MDLATQADRVRTRQDLVDFLSIMLTDLHQNAEEWENDTLERFLDALAAWTDGMDGYFRNMGEECPQQPSWNLIAHMLVAATIYE